jgi:hypothetical protein
MSNSSLNTDSLLVLDVGTIQTRAMLFDIVDGRYRFLVAGSAPSTAGAPVHDISDGIRSAIDRLQSITGRTLLGPDKQLIIPTRLNGWGVDGCAATISAGPPLKTVVVGLLEDVSLESARRLAMTACSLPLETISLDDRRTPEERLDFILRMRPDLLILAGGMEGGASQSVLKLLESVGLACYLMPETHRPEVLYVGNQNLRQEVSSRLENIVKVHVAPNIRPTLENEQLDAAQAQLAEIYGQIRARQIPGVKDLNAQAGGQLAPTSTAFGRIIRFLGKTHPTAKGVLGVDVGASATTIAAAFNGDLTLGVYPQFGLSSMAGTRDLARMEDIIRWLPQEIPAGYVQEYLANKSLFPTSMPVTSEDLMIEQAVARQALQGALKLASSSFSARAVIPGSGLLPWFEPILATGSVLTRAPVLAQSMLMLLDGLQPTGVTTIVIDQNYLSPALGAAAAVNPVLAVQVLDSNAFLHLGTVISPLGNARPGTPVLQLKMTYENGHEASLDVKQGSLEVLPLPVGQTARLQLQPLHRYDVGMGAPGRGGGLRVVGGALGVVIDARGRPLLLPDDPARRVEMLKKWLWTLGG